MHRLKCRNCLMFVITNIRVLYVHWKECVRKKGNSQKAAIVLGLWYLVYAGISYIFNFLVCFLHHFIIFLLHFFVVSL